MKIIKITLYAAYSKITDGTIGTYAEAFADQLREAGAVTAASEYDTGKAPRVTDGDRLEAAVEKLWPKAGGLPLAEAEIEDLIEAIDSHIYWQLADTNARNDGAVNDDAIEDGDARREVKRFRALDGKLTDEKIRVITEAMKK